MHTYLIFLRGVNVGGKGIIKMSELKAAIEALGYEDVRTYINSGNIILRSSEDKKTLAAAIVKVLIGQFDLDIQIAIYTDREWANIIAEAPDWWGRDAGWRHNLLILTTDISVYDALVQIGELKPEFERMASGNGVIYQSHLIEKAGRTTFSKMIGQPVYKQMTIRNYNTSVKMAALTAGT